MMRAEATSRTRSHLVAAFLVAVAVAVGEFVIIAVTQASRWLLPNVFLAWLMSTAVVTMGGYVLFGLPIVRSFERSEPTRQSREADFRATWAGRILRGGTPFAFVLGSLVGGAPGLAWFYGSRCDVRARQRAMLGQTLMAGFWCAFYLELLHWLLG